MRLTEMTWFEGLATTMPSWYVLGLLLPATFWMAHKFPLEGGRWRISVLAHLPAAALFTVVHLSASSYISDWLLYRGVPPMPFGTNLSRLLGLYFVVDIFFYVMFVGFAHALDYRRMYWERERDAAQLALKTSRLEGSLTRANLESLRMQLNPHFLFNTLNAISVMALKGERHGVVRTLTLLSDLLRVSLENKAQVVPLREELQFLERYLEIEEIRFKDRLTVRMALSPETLDAEVPTLVLQPLVENAIRHGISRKPGVGEIVVSAVAADGMLVLSVSDTGPGFGQRIETARQGIGLANTRARLEQLYGANQALLLEDAPGGGATVRIRMPFRICAPDSASATAAFAPLAGIALPPAGAAANSSNIVEPRTA
jgi:signal transduction histidine kinase